MNYLNGRKVELLVVPVRCESEQGTAFFISENQLLTARHIVRAHLKTASPAQIHISIEGNELLCKAEDLHLPERNIDVALLTIVQENRCKPQEFLSLLSDRFTPQLTLHVYGYPQEVAMGCNLVDMKVKNRLELSGNQWYGRALIREDNLNIRHYDGMSGSPVINISGRVIGILTLQINEVLNYLPISDIEDHLGEKGIGYDNNWEKDDTTPLGTGSSIQQCADAVATIHGRYTPQLHQENKSIKQLFDFFSDRKELEKSHSKAKDFVNRIKTLDPVIRKDLQSKFNFILYLDNESSLPNLASELHSLYEYVGSEKFSRAHLSLDHKINNRFNDTILHNDDFRRLELSQTKFLCLTGKAGSGKTHHLCDYALNNSPKANFYIFFGTGFNSGLSAITQIRESGLQNKDFSELNQEMALQKRFAVIIIDAINEGPGCFYWNNDNLGALRTEIQKYDNIRLIISVRSPFDRELTDLSNRGIWKIHEIEGFEDKDKAIDDYFRHYNIPNGYKSLRIEAFKTPLFLKIFCETFNTLTYQERQNIGKQKLYEKYVTKKNLEVSKLIDEDPIINITHQYLLKLAQYCVHNTHFNSISRTKAREYSRQLAPYRTWSKDLLNACLTTNLLLEDQSITGDHAVMFEYENLGDYYMATAMIDSWKSLPAILNLICKKKKYFDKHPEVSDHKFCNSVKALFDCLHCSGVEVQNETPIKKGQVLYDLYYEYLIESEINHDKLLDILLKLDEDKINPIILLQEKTDLSLEDTLIIHNKLMEYKTIGRRDLIWTLFVNQMYDWNGTDYIAYIQDKGFFSLKSEDEQTQTIIFLTWLLTSSYPSFRAFIMRMLTSLFYSNTSLISKAIGLFGKVNDPYVTGGLFCSISGVLLVSRDIETVTSIAHQIYDLYYEKPESVPQDLIVRQWTLKIIERAHYLDKECNLWNLIKTPFKPVSEDSPRLSEFNSISKNIFGLQQGSLMMYESIFGFSDFNRYIIGTNYNSRSNDYFVGTDDGQYDGYSLSDIKAEMSYYIKDIFGWNDKLGRLDNGKYSMDRQYNEKERIGKKFQWLAWYRINAHLMDVCKVSKRQFFYSETAEEDDLTPNPYPWNTAEVSKFDPTLKPENLTEKVCRLSGIEKQVIKEAEDKNWINRNDLLPDFRYIAKSDKNDEFILLMGYDTSRINDKSVSLFTNSCFVKKEFAEKFGNWAKDKNFYGRWMPENRGSTTFHWHDYPWSDTYKISVEENPWSQPENSPCDVLLSYVAQLQEDWEAIDPESEYLTTVYMPCVELMDNRKLYCSEIRGIIREENGNVACVNTEMNNGIGGLFIRRDILNKFLKDKDYEMFYYVCGEKTEKFESGTQRASIIDLSGAYRYNTDEQVTEIQKMRVIERAKPEQMVDDPDSINDLITKYKEGKGLLQKEALELLNISKLISDEILDPDEDDDTYMSSGQEDEYQDPNDA